MCYTGNLSQVEIRVGLVRLVHAPLIAFGLFGGRCYRVTNDHPKGIHILLPRTCKCYFIWQKRTLQV